MDRFSAMSAFVRVVEAGSFTRAAETMDLPKPTVTRFIQGLERDLRVRLLDRTTRSVTLTAEGAAYYERVVHLLAELSDIESTAKQSVARPSGRLRVDVATAIATNVLIPALPDFYRAYPEIELEFGISNRFADLVADNVDCVIRTGELRLLLEEWRTPTVPVHVLYRPNRFLGAKVRAFIDWTVALFERNPDLKIG